MSRLIDIDELKGCAIIRPTTYEEIEHIRACKNLISHDDIPTAMERSTAYYNDRWIPCSERLPETEEMCWITYEDADGKLHVGEDIYCDYGGWYETEDTAVKAWMYVNTPAPYQPKGEK